MPSGVLQRFRRGSALPSKLDHTDTPTTDEVSVPRMLRSAISAFTRVFDALCGALLIRGPFFGCIFLGSRLCGAS
jgi:hypothetical protein